MRTAMILAAGRGSRLRPLTDHTPKPLCLIQQKPLLYYHLQHLAHAGFEQVIINHAHLGYKIRQAVLQHTWPFEICFSPEPPGGLETGGGIVNARALLGDAPFITVNADIYTDFNFKALQLPPKSLAHLILVPTPAHRQHGDFGLTDGYLNPLEKTYVFSGIAYYDARFFATLQPGRFSVTPLLKEAAKKQLVTAEVFTGAWVDIGTPAQLLALSS